MKMSMMENARTRVRAAVTCALLVPGLSLGQSSLGTGGTASQNYVQKTVYLAPLAAAPSNPTTAQALRDITYFDGLGRPVQEIGVKASGGTGYRDLVTPFAYDGYGRQDRDYLPYATATGAGGAFKSGVTAAQGSYYSSAVTVPAGQTATAYASGPRRYEPSPLNRVTEQGFPGLAWQPASSRGSTGRTVATAYATNNTLGFGDAATRRVLRYGATLNGSGVPALTLNGAYAAGQLHVTVTKDENWVSGRLHTAEEYTDKQGRVVLLRTFTTASGASGILSTYYVYNDLGQLSFVLPPGRDAEFNPDSGTLPTATMLDNFAYRYRYDKRGRMSYRRLPGGGAWETFNYNRVGWLVFHQDSRQVLETYGGFTPGAYHTFHKYDGQGRVIIKGVEKSRSQDRETIEGYFEGHAYQWEERSTASGHLHGYTNLSIPGATANMDILEVRYYDRYDGIPGLPHNASASYSQLTQGRLVASKAKVLGTTATYLWTVYYYDDKGNVVREWKHHYLGGSSNANKFDDITREYTFTGQLKKEIRKHHTTSASVPNVTVTTEYGYDHRQRLTHTWKTVNTGTRTLIARNTYNEVGQVRTKQLHSTNSGTSWGQQVTYSYNERGWLKESDAPLFRQVLGYNGGGSPQYNGNISSQQFTRHNLTPALVTDTYSYTYDAVGRLTEGVMSGSKGRETLTYDRNGNIRTLVRTGTNSTVVDNLVLNHTGNRLTGVVDAAASTDANYQLPGTTTYGHDANGNLKTRVNSGSTGNNITATVYNYFNLPQSVTAVAGNVTYTYDGTGRKLRSVGGILGQTRDYIDGIEYSGGTMELIHTEEGRITRSGSTYTYHYFLKDHLGNNRVGFAQGTNVTAPNFTADYYPFGLQYRQYIRAGSPKNNYLYNGKELQDGIKQYDYGARLYDPVIGRWGSMDPLAESFDNVSPYNYGMNNPMRFIDPTGMAALDTLQQGVNDNLPSSAVPGDIIEIEEQGSFELLPTASVSGGTMTRMSLRGTNRTPYSGFGLIGFVLNGGHEDDGYQYDINGRNLGPSPIMGYPMDFSRGNIKGTLKISVALGKQVAKISTRLGRNGKAVEIIFKDGSKIDITPTRVKEWVPKNHPNAPAGTLDKVKFPEFLPGSKGHKRIPKQEEIDLLNSLF